MTLRNLCKNNDMFESLLAGPDLSKIVLKDIKMEDGPSWDERVKRAFKIKDSLKESLTVAKDENIETFFDFKEKLLKFIIVEISKQLKHDVKIQGDDFVLTGIDMELFDIAYNDVLKKVKDIKDF